jgi:hypothetical protein
MRRTTQPSPSTQRRRRGRLQPGSSSPTALETDDVVAGSTSASFVGLTEAVERARSCCTGAAAAGASGTRRRVEPNRRVPAAVRSPAWEKRYVTGCPPVPGIHAGFVGGLGETIPKAQFCFGAMAHNMSNGKQKRARLRKAPAAGTRLPWGRCRCSTAVVQRFCKPKVGSSILSTGTIHSFRCPALAPFCRNRSDFPNGSPRRVGLPDRKLLAPRVIRQDLSADRRSDAPPSPRTPARGAAR